MIKVASYCRVSTDKEDQANSFEAQQLYFQQYIERMPDWELYKIYADEGITGTSTKKRTQFKRMINDAYEKCFQLIITKEVSRFSRNILDTISYTRELKSIGVGVLFLLDGINTMSPDAELYLSIMASLAQEESRKTSSRVVWGQTRQMERGVVFGQSLLGYDVKGGSISVNAAGANLVRLIFEKYAVDQISTSEIARFLTREGYCTHRGNRQWRASTIIKILKNEKYVGDLVQKKTYTPDYLTHEKKRNTGEVSMIRIENHHEAIIDRELWNAAQMRLQKNNKHVCRSSGHSNCYVFSGKIKCGECGASFVGRFKYLKNGGKQRRWSCSTAVQKGKTACDIGKLVRDDDAMQMLSTTLKHLRLDRSTIVHSIAQIALDAILAGEYEESDTPSQLQHEIAHIKRKKEIALDSFFSGDISSKDLKEMNMYYEEQLVELGRKWDIIAERECSRDKSVHMKENLQANLLSILNGETVSASFYKTILDSLTVFKDRHMELKLKNLSQVFQFAE